MDIGQQLPGGGGGGGQQRLHPDPAPHLPAPRTRAALINNLFFLQVDELEHERQLPKGGGGGSGGQQRLQPDPAPHLPAPRTDRLLPPLRLHRGLWLPRQRAHRPSRC